MRPGRTSAPHACIRARPGALWTGARGNAAGTALSAKALFPAQGRGRESVRGGGEGRRLLFDRRNGVNSRRAGLRFGKARPYADKAGRLTER